MTVHIIKGNCLDVLRTLSEASVHCVVTSPPYWGLRDYGVAGQLGLEATPAEYVEKMVAVFREVRRVLRDDGTLWLNLGDSYATGAGAVGQHPGGKVQGANWKGATTSPNRMPQQGLKPKDLVGIPWRVAFALQADGWYLRQDIIWHKPNPMPESVRDRCTKAHEYLFLLAKSERYYFDADAIAEPSVRPEGAGNVTHKGATAYEGGDEKMRTKGGLTEIGARDTRNKRSVWTVTTQPFKEAHFATFPPALIEPCILAGCPALTCGKCGTDLDSRYGKVRTGTKGKDVAPVRMVRGEGISGPEKSGAELLQQGLCVSLDREEPQHNEGALHDIEGLHSDIPAGSPGRIEGRVRDGASPCVGSASRSSATSDGGCASSRRQSRKQQAEEFGNAHEAGARQPTEAQDRNDSLPPLRREDTDFSVCPGCRAALDEVGVQRGAVLDCFGGAGTTGLVADRQGRDAILIELNPAYAAMAQKRIKTESPLFADVV